MLDYLVLHNVQFVYILMIEVSARRIFTIENGLYLFFPTIFTVDIASANKKIT